MKKTLFMMIAAAAIAFAGCKEDDDETTPVLDVDKTAIDAAYTAGSYPIAVTSNTTWVAAVDNEAASWCTVLPATGTADGTVTVNVAENAIVETRTAIVTFTTGALTRTVAVTQATVAPVLDVDRTAINATAAAAAYAIGVTSNTAWTAVVDAAATWCTVQPAGGAGDGVVTVNMAENPATVTRSATVTFTADALTRVVSVTQAIPTPPHAASMQTWVFGDQLWSDAIHVPDCKDATFSDDRDNPKCRSYTDDNGKPWYYYNWPYVHQNADVLCPSPWHVPSASEFITLANNTNAMTLINEWGYGGYAQGSEVGAFTNADYWSSTEYSITHYAQYLVYHNYFISVVTDFKHFGFQVRCVK